MTEKQSERHSEPKPGDTVSLLLKGGTIKIGTWLPRPDIFGLDTVVIKLSTGYNVGIKKETIKEIHVTQKYHPAEIEHKKITQNPALKQITILHTGGTIASQVDYHTGGVVARFAPEEFLQLFPELQQMANVDSKLVFQMFSEDMEPEHWKALAEAVEKEYKVGAAGVIITHGTDTMHYTAAALSFMLQNCPIPVVLVGSQRSPDRGSSDAYLNLFSAVRFAVETDFAGVAICMHGSTDDDSCLVHLGLKVKKMHTSRRDTFRTINAYSLAKIRKEKIEHLEREYKKQKEIMGKFYVAGKFNKKVGIIKIRPGMEQSEFQFFLDNNYKGLIIEGTGLGHAPINVIDELTKHHPALLTLLKKMSEKMILVMCSQCIYGRTDMHVYSTGRYLLQAGVLNGEDMMPETAYVKLGWLLGNYSEKQAREMMQQNIAGELFERTHVDTFLK